MVNGQLLVAGRMQKADLYIYLHPIDSIDSIDPVSLRRRLHNASQTPYQKLISLIACPSPIHHEPKDPLLIPSSPRPSTKLRPLPHVAHPPSEAATLLTASPSLFSFTQQRQREIQIQDLNHRFVSTGPQSLLSPIHFNT